VDTRNSEVQIYSTPRAPQERTQLSKASDKFYKNFKLMTRIFKAATNKTNTLESSKEILLKSVNSI
jgi:hypothetical protein